MSKSGCLEMLGSKAFGKHAQITPTRPVGAYVHGRVSPVARSYRHFLLLLVSFSFTHLDLIFRCIVMAAPMSVDKTPKIDVDEFLTLAISETPQELHAFFESFRSLYSRKCVWLWLGYAKSSLLYGQTMAPAVEQAVGVL